MKAMKFLRAFGLNLLIFVLTIILAIMSDGVESKIFFMCGLIYGELLCLHIDIKADKDEKG